MSWERDCGDFLATVYTSHCFAIDNSERLGERERGLWEEQLFFDTLVRRVSARDRVIEYRAGVERARVYTLRRAARSFLCLSKQSIAASRRHRVKLARFFDRIVSARECECPVRVQIHKAASGTRTKSRILDRRTRSAGTRAALRHIFARSGYESSMTTSARTIDATMDYLQTCLIFYLLILCFCGGRSIDISQCIAPLGMESGAIPDTDITASSSFDSGNVGPHHGRLKQESHGGAWCPKQQITTEPREWLEIDLHTVHMITATGTQGRFGNGQGAEFSEAYLLEYWRPKLGKWVRYRDFTGEEVIQGNSNTYLESKHELQPPILATKIRFLPYSYHRRTVCMRVELYGCPWNDGIVSYSMPQGDKRNNWEFFDATYDGYWDGQLLRGLGQLTDGKNGPDNFKMSFYDEKGQGWVGWKNDTKSGHPLEIKFEFDHVREFSAVHIYCNNQFTKDVQVFSEVNITFSVGGEHFLGEPIVYCYMEDRIFEHSRNVTIKLHHRIGKFVKLKFAFASRWIMISEITFDSDIAHGNFTLESPPTTEAPRPRDRTSTRDNPLQAEVPVAKQDDPTYMAVIIGILTAVILLLAVAIFLIVTRHRQRKNFASPLGAKSAIPSGNHQHLSPESAYGTTEKDPSLMTYRVEELDDRYAGTKLTTLPRDLNDRLLGDVRLDEYQEPFHENKYRESPHAAYYGYSTVVIDNKDLHDNVEQSDATYDYAVPMPVPSVSSDQDSVFSKSSSRGSAKACLQSFFPPPPPPMSAPPPRGSSNLTYSNPPSPEPVCERERRGSKRREHSLHRYA